MSARSMRAAVVLSMLCVSATLRAQPPARDYLVLVASESVDRVALVRFGPTGARVEREKYVGWSKMEVAGPHGVAITPSAKEYFVTIAHGTPFGKLVKYDAATDTQLGSVMLGNFPATAQVSPDGALVFVVNFNLHGDMEPSDVSVVAAKEMVEIARIRTCTMPHGSRLSSDGTKHYSACMMDETLAEIDASTLSVSRHFFLTKGKEMGMTGAPPERGASEHAGHGGAATDMSGHGMEPPKPGDISCSPTWAQPSRDGTRVWVACNKSSDLVEIDTKSWTLVRRIAAGPGVYNLATTNNGARIIATNKRDASVSVFDAVSGKELARIPTTRKVVHGIAVSDDDRYAFISVEGVGSEPGTVDVIDLATLQKVASVDVGQQAGGIDFLRSEPVKR
ncbi:YncE family protein [Gemmatimonas sp.]|uniref:YncE family protein n=1 Tax=Gemmatimonas sp. TaxID=1962908 RepID=UPI0037BF9121